MKRFFLMSWTLGAVLAGCMTAALANPYATFQEREIKALSPEEQRGLLEGYGMGFALPAELHGYPGPMHVLEVADALDLEVDQRKKTERLFDEMRERARGLGARIVELERELDERFASRDITREDIEALTVEIGELRGQLRHVHLSYHLRMDALLTDEQKAAYREARGYQGEGEGPHSHDRGHEHHHHHHSDH